MTDSPTLYIEGELPAKTGIPLGHVSVSGDDKLTSWSKINQANGLSSEMQWFIPGLAYVYMGMDKSLFDLFSWAHSQPMEACTVMSPKKLIQFEGVGPDLGSWSNSLQGIPRKHASSCIDYLRTFEFRRKTDMWHLSFHKMTIQDPFKPVLNLVEISLILPSVNNMRLEAMPYQLNQPITVRIVNDAR